ncbi:unnamed protein product [Brassica rapa]|uniref:Uncharacterized protein n=1 Tax=Brassica campestris TaxID=3711 RepID=A0A3P5ZV30_BRACM|nr:unnamed protein product [Brassica rapa]VDC84666.1 unnamed protein product [Brassica rapa]
MINNPTVYIPPYPLTVTCVSENPRHYPKLETLARFVSLSFFSSVLSISKSVPFQVFSSLSSHSWRTREKL